MTLLDPAGCPSRPPTATRRAQADGDNDAAESDGNVHTYPSG